MAVINLVIHKNKILDIESMDFKKYIENNIDLINLSDFSVFEAQYIDASVIKYIDYYLSGFSQEIGVQRKCAEQRDYLEDKIDLFNDILENKLSHANKNLKINNINDLFPDFFEMVLRKGRSGITLKKESYDPGIAEITPTNNNINAIYEKAKDNLVINIIGEYCSVKTENIRSTVEIYKKGLIKGLKDREGDYNKK